MNNNSVETATNWLPERARQYPYLLLSVTDTLPSIIQYLKDGEDIDICIENFDNLVSLKRIDVDFKQIKFLIEVTKCSIVSELETYPVNTIWEFIELYNNIKGESV